jgi:HPr kinase/phosphorylase
MSAKLTVGRLIERLRETLELEHDAATDGLDRVVESPNISSPGLVLAGYVDRFPARRLQVLGETEITYLKSLDPDIRRQHLATFFSFPIPCLFVTKAQQPGPDLLELAAAAGVAVIRSRH